MVLRGRLNPVVRTFSLLRAEPTRGLEPRTYRLQDSFSTLTMAATSDFIVYSDRSVRHNGSSGHQFCHKSCHVSSSGRCSHLRVAGCGGRHAGLRGAQRCRCTAKPIRRPSTHSTPPRPSRLSLMHCLHLCTHEKEWSAPRSARRPFPSLIFVTAHYAGLFDNATAAAVRSDSNAFAFPDSKNGND